MKEFKLYWQLESTDCGPACLRMICAFYGRDVSQQYIKDKLSISRIGLTIRDLKTRASELGFSSVIAKATIFQINKITFPVILHWNSNHFVVLYKIVRHVDGTYSYYIADPSSGKIKFTREEFERNWLMSGGDCGIALILKPTDRFYSADLPRQKNDWNLAKSLLLKYLPSKKKVLFAVLLMGISMACSWMVPFIYQSIIDKGVVLGDKSVIIKLFLVQLSFFIGYVLSNTFSSYIISKVNLRVGIDYVGELLDKIMRLPMKYFDTRLNTEFIQRLDDFNRIRSFLADNLINLLYYIVNAVVYFLLLAYYNWNAVIMFAVMSAIVMVWNLHFTHERKFIDYSLFTENARNRNLLYEIINNMPDIKVNNAQQAQRGKWEKNQSRINGLMLKQMTLNYKQNVGRDTMNRLRDILIICYCCIVTVQGDLSIGVLMSVSYILGQLGAPVEQLQSFVTQYQMFKVSLSRLSEVQRKEDEPVGDGKDGDYSLKTGITIKDMTFKYEGSFSPNIFENLSVFFPSGKTTAIVGNSGSGKTTLIKLILGFYSPQSGSVEVDNTNLGEIGVNRWRKRCGVVLQDGKIFSGTIADNISLGSGEIDEERVKSVSKLSCIDEFIERQPGKYNMKIGSDGIELSQGQKQRILIARALYKNPQLLIFDEATSSLDTKNERKIMDNLDGFFRDRTVIIVAHRLSTVVKADNILFLENGEIVERGTHRELVAEKGKYYELIKNQLELEN